MTDLAAEVGAQLAGGNRLAHGLGDSGQLGAAAVVAGLCHTIRVLWAQRPLPPPAPEVLPPT